jgi:hypothetical protein
VTRRRRSPGCSLVELRLRARACARHRGRRRHGRRDGPRLPDAPSASGRGDDLLSLGLEAFTLDVRRAGFDPGAIGLDALVEATTARLRLLADLDGDGAIDATSEELITIACDVPGGRLSRIVGTQSLPLANGVVACALAYADAGGAAVPMPPGGLDAGARRRVRRATLDLALAPPGSRVPSARSATVALRSQP